MITHASRPALLLENTSIQLIKSYSEEAGKSYLSRIFEHFNTSLPAWVCCLMLLLPFLLQPGRCHQGKWHLMVSPSIPDVHSADRALQCCWKGCVSWFMCWHIENVSWEGGIRCHGEGLWLEQGLVRVEEGSWDLARGASIALQMEVVVTASSSMQEKHNASVEKRWLDVCRQIKDKLSFH